jgi:predicted adenine nucleotide alpha hydrolase (AANH) superfamily ATPase
MMNKKIHQTSIQQDHKVLLHTCCAPCSCAIIEAMKKEEFDLTLFFYNPNIQPVDEYEIRKLEVIRFADKLAVPFIDADYDAAHWFDLTKGLENEPERGKRCSLCFDMRLEKTAEYAHQNGFKVFTSSLGISRWKDFDQVTRAGIQAASRYRGLTYWAYNWRKKGGSQRMIEIIKNENFYKQFYCGCLYSLQQANEKRRAGPDVEPLDIKKIDLPKKR